MLSNRAERNTEWLDLLAKVLLLYSSFLTHMFQEAS